MNKKITISIILIFLVVVIVFGIWKFSFRNNSITENNNSYNIENDVNNIVNISTQFITDDCLNEWTDIESTSSNISNETTRYLVKDIDGYISIYYLDDFNEEILYKKTDISTEYLSLEDIENLKVGIEVNGAKELNQLLEDFE